MDLVSYAICPTLLGVTVPRIWGRRGSDYTHVCFGTKALTVFLQVPPAAPRMAPRALAAALTPDLPARGPREAERLARKTCRLHPGPCETLGLRPRARTCGPTRHQSAQHKTLAPTHTPALTA